jgi:hypothetical protein
MRGSLPSDLASWLLEVTEQALAGKPLERVLGVDRVAARQDAALRLVRDEVLREIVHDLPGRSLNEKALRLERLIQRWPWAPDARIDRLMRLPVDPPRSARSIRRICSRSRNLATRRFVAKKHRNPRVDSTA